tara:strand:- start:7 stop:1248 length:1242 start_codon:yes stop_codon:yes gene_type:complete
MRFKKLVWLLPPLFNGNFMSLLKLIRTDYGLTNNQIVKILRDKRCPNSWGSNKIYTFTEVIRHYGSKGILLANDIISNENIEICNDCGSREFLDNMRSCYQGDYYICDGCCDDNYTYSDSQDTYISYEDYDEENNEYQEESGVYDYNHRVENDLGKLCLPHEKSTSENRQIYYGIELEVEKRNSCPHDMPYYITDHVLSGFAQCKSDGSLDHGFEITTAPATFGYHKKEWEKFFSNDKCMTKLKGWNTDTAGLHIHISRKALSPTDIGKILVFINDDTNTPFIKAIAGRTSDQWAKRSKKKVSDFHRSSEKYEAVNMSHPHTIELRIFKSNISKHGFYRVLEFTDALVRFCKTYTGLTGLSLHYKTFLRFMDNEVIKSQYPNLTAWLIRKGYLKGRPSRKVSLQEELHDTATN